ncbi:MAG TPA: ferric reductase-like transmembrane domain-containing protein [Jatrophihabitantaceae bacterium]|jgi:3-phenylpropionate/trans-cinnamate dioxygenase ferredoxin reductase subunit
MLAYATVGLTPVALMLFVRRVEVANVATALSLAFGLIALSLLGVALALPARMRSILSSFGIEWVLRNHRLVGLLAAGLILLHLLFVFIGDPRGVGILNLVSARRPVWAATISTVAVLALVILAERRRRHQPRYEGWRLTHVGLALTAVITAWLHVWWLRHLVEDPLMAAWFALLAFAMGVVTLRRWVWRPLRARRRSYLIEQVRPVSGNAITVVVRAQGHRGLPFHAGQFAWLKIGTSPFVFEEHPFTIASTAEQPQRMEFTIKALGDFTELLIGLRRGRHVYLDGPYGRFTLEGLPRNGFVFVAGGIGITPMLSMLRTLADRGDRGRHQLLVAARTIDDVVLRREIHELRGRLDLDIVEVLADPPPGWRGEVGRIDPALLARRLRRGARHHDVFLCGPPGLVVDVGRMLRDLGIPAHRIHTELFDIS